MNKILTIIIPTYNMEKYLRKCLDSLIIEENMDKVEVLVVNDGSKDSSSDIAHEYQKKYPNTYKVIDKENGNYGSCINRGLKEATGKYIKILDADDSFSNEAFKSYISTILDVDADLIINGGSYVFPDGKIKKDFFWTLPRNKVLLFKDSVEGIIESRPSMHTYAYRTDLLRGIGYHQTEGVSYTDQEWIFLPMYYVNTVYATETNLYQYLIGREGQTVDPKVTVKSIGQKDIVCRQLINAISTIDDTNKDGEQYLCSRLKICLTELYRYHLVKYCKDLNIKNLIEFDCFFKQQCPKYYTILNDLIISEKYPVHYVKIWRRKKNKEKLPFLLSIYNRRLNKNK